MTREIYRTSAFKKDVRGMKRRNKDFTVFRQTIQDIADGTGLEEKYRDHKLSGSFEGKRECHIEPDWLLIYETEEDYLTLVRTGTHADLFR
jgi:mRNA interferase YafQ